MMTTAEAVARLNHWRYALRISGVDDVIALVQEQARNIESQKGLIAAMCMVADKQTARIERLTEQRDMAGNKWAELEAQLDVAAQEYAEAEKEIEKSKCCGNCVKGMATVCQDMNVVGWGMCDKWALKGGE